MTSSENKQVVLAMMFGDTYVDCNYRSGKARLDIYHCSDQYEYIMWKCGVLNSINGIRARVVEKVDNRPLKSGGVRRGYRLQTNFSRYFFKLYTSPTKFQVKQLVKPMALAVLWQDDGSLMMKHNRREYCSAQLCTDRWDLAILRDFMHQFNRAYGWTFEPMQYTMSYIRLRMRKKEMIKFTDIVWPFTTDCMKYKLVTL